MRRRAFLRLTVAAAALIALPAGAAWPAPVVVKEKVLSDYDVPYVPTPPEVVARMLALAEVGAGDFVIDLGSGDGRIAIAAARDHGARALGVELQPELVARARESARRDGVADRATFERADMFLTDISRATVLTLYLGPDINLSIRRRIFSDMRPGARVVSHQFDMGDWPPDRQASEGKRRVYLWIVPAKVDGRWRVETPDGDFEVRLAQRYQSIEGTALIDGRERPLLEPNLRGDAIRFAVARDGSGRQTFSGRVDGGVMKPASDEGAAAGWRASRR